MNTMSHFCVHWQSRILLAELYGNYFGDGNKHHFISLFILYIIVLEVLDDVIVQLSYYLSVLYNSKPFYLYQFKYSQPRIEKVLGGGVGFKVVDGGTGSDTGLRGGSSQGRLCWN